MDPGGAGEGGESGPARERREETTLQGHPSGNPRVQLVSQGGGLMAGHPGLGTSLQQQTGVTLCQASGLWAQKGRSRGCLL